MSGQRTGFATADIDTTLLYHPKVRALFNDHPEIALSAFLAWLAVILDGWRTGHRVNVARAWPPYLNGATVDEAISALTDAGLTDPAGLIPEAAWEEWYGAAAARRARMRELARSRWTPPR